MNTDKDYAAVKNPAERAAAIAIIVDARRRLRIDPNGLVTVVVGKCPQFSEKAETLVKKTLGAEFSSATFSFSFDSKEKEITATITPYAVN